MKLSAAERLDLMRFVCSFVWTDLQVAARERELVLRIAARLGLDAQETRQVERWLQVPPRADEVDPLAIPRAHRELFLQAAELAVEADGRVVPAEQDALALFRDLVRDDA